MCTNARSLSSRVRLCVCPQICTNLMKGMMKLLSYRRENRSCNHKSTVEATNIFCQNTEKIFIEVSLMAKKIVGSVELSKCHEIVEIFCQYSSTSSSDFLRLLSLEEIIQNFLKRGELIKADLGFCVLLLYASHGLSSAMKMQQFSSSTTSIIKSTSKLCLQLLR